MPQIPCPSCARALNMPESMLGQQVRCPLCGHEFQVEESGAASAQTAGIPASTSSPGRGERFDYPPSEPRARSRSRGYDDYEEEEGHYDSGSAVAPGRTSAAVWMLIAGLLDLVVLLVFYVFVFTVERRPPPMEVFLIITVIAVIFYLVPLVFVFVAAGVVRNARGSGLVITGSITAFILAFELLLLTAGFGIGLVISLSNPWERRRMPIVVPFVFLFALIGLIISIIAGVKGLIATSRSPARRRHRYYY